MTRGKKVLLGIGVLVLAAVGWSVFQAKKNYMEIGRASCRERV